MIITSRYDAELAEIISVFLDVGLSYLRKDHDSSIASCVSLIWPGIHSGAGSEQAGDR